MQTLNDLRLFLGEDISPEILQLRRPIALIELLSPKISSNSNSNFNIQTPGKTEIGTPVKSLAQKPGVPTPPGLTIPSCDFLQGPVQRLDLIFKTGNNHIINGKVYLSSDYSPSLNSAALFWTPDVSSLIKRNGNIYNNHNNNNDNNNGNNGDNDDNNNSYNNNNNNNKVDDNSFYNYNNNNNKQSLSDLLDSVQYNPLLLNSSCQPAQPLLLPTILPNSVYCVPLFLRSEAQGIYKLRLLTEFIPKFDHLSSISKEIEININFLKPLNMNFSLLSDRESQCGIIREGFLSTIIQGDSINMTASLGCANSLGNEIKILGMTFLQSKKVSSNASNSPKMMNSNSNSNNDYYDDSSNINDNDNNNDDDNNDNIKNNNSDQPSLFQLKDNASSINLLHKNNNNNNNNNSNSDDNNEEETGTHRIEEEEEDISTDKSEDKKLGDNDSNPGNEPEGAVEVEVEKEVLKRDDDVDLMINTQDPDNDKNGNHNKNNSNNDNDKDNMSCYEEVILKKGEVYVTSTDILCLETVESPTIPFEIQVASMGDLYVDWRLHDNKILSPPDLTPWQTGQKSRNKNKDKNENENKRKNILLDFDINNIDDNIDNNIDNNYNYDNNNYNYSSNSENDKNIRRIGGENSIDNTIDFGDFDWLLQWGPLSSTIKNLIENNILAVDYLTSTTRVCGMVFAVPKVKITPSPFEVIVELSSTCYKNDILPLIIIIKNKLWSAEHLSLSIKTILPSLLSSSALANSSNVDNNISNHNHNSNSSNNNASQKPEISSNNSGISSSSSGFVVVGNTSSLLDVRAERTEIIHRYLIFS